MPPAHPPEPERSSVTRLPREVVTPTDARSIVELHRRALELGEKGEHARAARELERILGLEPDGELSERAGFEAAAEWDEAGELERAAIAYERAARRHPKSELSTTAWCRAIRLWTYLEHFGRAEELARSVLAREAHLGPFHRVVCLGAVALGRLSAGDELGASTFVERGREVIDAHRMDAAGVVSRDLAPIYYALGELRRRRADRIRFDPLPPDFAAALEERCQLLLDAQGAYSDAMRAQDAHWSSMAGYRVAELYQRLHQDLMRIEPPPSARSAEKRALFEGAMRLRYSVLLDKALGMLDHALSMAERTGEASAWTRRAERARAQVKKALLDQQAALQRLPYSKATLERALSDLGRRAARGDLGQQRARPRPASGPMP